MTKQVGKLLIKDVSSDAYLLMRRSDHPVFGADPDLPGGTLEDGETPEETTVREVYEEAGVNIEANTMKLLYNGADYSSHGTIYSLYYTELNERPEITISWEHSGYDWLSFEDLVEHCRAANDTFMHMVADSILKFRK